MALTTKSGQDTLLPDEIYGFRRCLSSAILFVGLLGLSVTYTHHSKDQLKPQITVHECEIVYKLAGCELLTLRVLPLTHI